MNMADDLVSSLKLQAKNIRHYWRRFQRQLKPDGKELQNAPRIFSNSFPKSGTHWLTQVLEGLPEVSVSVNSGLPAVLTFERESGRERTSTEILRDVKRLLPGDTGYGHVHGRSELVDYMTGDGWCTFFIVRDPRDIVVSHVFYVTEIEPEHVHHDYYTNVLKTFDERLRTSILGRPELGGSFPDIVERFQHFNNWMINPNIMVLRYEDAIAEPEKTIFNILQFSQKRRLKLTWSLADAGSILYSSMDPKRSPTFRQGKSGGWRKHFTPEITNLFKQTAGRLLIDLGYEKDLDWE
jgi:sulfotransferase 6B1